MLSSKLKSAHSVFMCLLCLKHDHCKCLTSVRSIYHNVYLIIGSKTDAFYVILHLSSICESSVKQHFWTAASVSRFLWQHCTHDIRHFSDADDSIFKAVLKNSHHVLYQYFPEDQHQQYFLTQRPHSKALIPKTTYLGDRGYTGGA